ncbi:hypothetical protein HMPREF0201_02341 [Cedecea davisae DSM 4568]|uniref:Uncharacterized protein n=1 Tax=Cedecea davisae DSM 4568 TaxID=566551 RepID=S3IUC1_9ENTR|nr:hypothetical protein HMPREF0201_02341 [Cedecea davisae DSM 4568]
MDLTLVSEVMSGLRTHWQPYMLMILNEIIKFDVRGIWQVYS